MVDALIVVVVLAMALLGWREGLVRALFGVTGIVIGALAGIVLVPRLLGGFGLSVAVSLAAVGVVVASAVGMRFLLVHLEDRLRARAHWTPHRSVDRPAGALFGGLAALAVCWMVGLAIAGSTLPVLSASANRSEVLRRLELHLPLSARLIDRFAEMGAQTDFPRFVDVFTAERIVEVASPPEAIVGDPDVVRAAGSVWAVVAQTTPVVGREGSAFLVAPGRVMTAAHVVAGADRITLDTPQGALVADVVVCDPEQDVAVLAVPGLTGRVLTLDDGVAATGDAAAMIGYPGGGDLVVTPARVRERHDWQSADIHGDGRYEHDAYVVRGEVRSGDSGGPLVGPDGSVLGMVLASSRVDSDTGYALTAAQVMPALVAGRVAPPGSDDRC